MTIKNLHSNKILIFVLSLFLLVSLVSCRKVDKSKNLMIVEHKGSSYTLKYVAKELDFGNFYLLIDNNKLTGFYTEYSDLYLLNEYYMTVRDNNCGLKLEYKDNKTFFYPANPINFYNEDNELNDFNIIIYVKYIDRRKETTFDNTIKFLGDSSIKVTTSPEALTNFIK